MRGISWARWLLLSASVVLSLICLILATESFKISEGEIQIFEDTWISFRLFQQYCCKFSEKITTVYDPWSFSFQKKLQILSFFRGKIHQIRVWNAMNPTICHFRKEDLNLGRLQKLRKEIFPDAPGDYEKAPFKHDRAGYPMVI